MGDPDVSLHTNVGHHTFLSLQKPARSEGQFAILEWRESVILTVPSLGARMGSDHYIPG
jgi:hypothetical protein